MLAVTLACAAGSAPDAQAPAPSQQQPTFRLEANFVRVDVYPTVAGAPITDLTRGDFEIFEDGVPQQIETFEHIQIPLLTPVEQQRDPDSVRQMRAAAENPRTRIFVIFLDTFHTDLGGSHRMQRSLVTMIDRMLSADDLFAVMTPHMSPSDLALGRKSVTVEGYLRRYWAWGEREWLMPQDPVERRYTECYPPEPGERISLIARKMIDRRREKIALDSLEDLSLYLRGIREERKAVIAVTNGWLLPRDDRSLAGPGAPPGALGTTPDGRLTVDRHGEDLGYRMSDCERDRQVLAYTDLFQEFHDLMDVANRGNVSIYPVDSRGLAATDTPMMSAPSPLQPAMVAGPVDEFRRVATRVGNLRALAENTDGIAVVDTNDIDRGLRKIVADMTSYYLVGYYSKNAKLDGRFRQIKVRVKRPGVDVRARRGYKAATADQLRPPPMTSKAGPPAGVQAALAGMTVARQAPVRTSIGFPPRSAVGPLRVTATVEIDSAASRGDFAKGGDIAVVAAGADGAMLGQGRASLRPGTRSTLIDLGEVATAGGDLVVRTRVRPAGGEGIAITEMTTVTAAAQQGAAVVLWRRGPGTAMRFEPTADARFARADRMRADLLMTEPDTTVTAALLDRQGGETTVPVTTATRTEAGRRWATAELALAPLAPADYVLKMTLAGPAGRVEVFTGIRVVP